MTVTDTGVAVPLETVIVPMRLVAERFSFATNVKDPLAPVPDAPASASQAEPLSADQLQLEPAVVTSIWTGLLVPAAATVVLPGTVAWAKTELHETAAASWVIAISTGFAVPLMMVIVAERLVVAEFALAE